MLLLGLGGAPREIISVLLCVDFEMVHELG